MRKSALAAAFGAMVGAAAVTCTANAGPPPPTGFELGARVMGITGNYGFGTVLGGQLGGRLTRHVSLGGYFDFLLVPGGVHPSCCRFGPTHADGVRGGIFTDLHIVPHGFVDPYFRFALGVANNTQTAVEGEIDFGLDFRVHRVAFGPFLAWIQPFRGDWPVWGALGGGWCWGFEGSRNPGRWEMSSTRAVLRRQRLRGLWDACEGPSRGTAIASRGDRVTNGDYATASRGE